jgi:RimJ/RimL family protein N-acetyltransferase
MITFMPMNYTRDWEWIQVLLGIAATDKTRGIVAIRDTGERTEPVGVAVFDNWTFNSVCVHWWIDTPMVIRNGFFEEIADYIFNVCNKQIMIGLVPSTNEKTIKLAKHIGFEEVYKVKDGYQLGVDQVVLEGRLENLGHWLPNTNEEAA